MRSIGEQLAFLDQPSEESLQPAEDGLRGRRRAPLGEQVGEVDLDVLAGNSGDLVGMPRAQEVAKLTDGSRTPARVWVLYFCAASVGFEVDGQLGDGRSSR